jgi:hypothetical protein
LFIHLPIKEHLGRFITFLKREKNVNIQGLAEKKKQVLTHARATWANTLKLISSASHLLSSFLPSHKVLPINPAALVLIVHFSWVI